ncbi:MAG TPA: hypothetical protein PK225_14150 [Azonexus sp.]|nr:hypothetical protein [Azonexus sp.]
MEKTRGAGSCQQDERRRDASAALEGMYAARRAALKRLIDQQFNGNERAFALKIEYPASQINDMRKGRKGFGEKSPTNSKIVSTSRAARWRFRAG